MVTRGEVWWYEAPDLGRRPVLILTRAAVADRLTQVLGVPATTVVRNIPTEVALDAADGMPRGCVLTLDNLAQVRPALCTERITQLSSARMAEVCRALAVATDC